MLTYCTIHVNQIIVLYTLNLHSAVCQLHFNKTVKKIVTWLMKTQALLSLPSILLKHCCKVRKIYHKIFGYIFLKSSRIINSSNANIYHWSLLCLRRHAKDLMHIIVLIINHPLQTVLLLYSGSERLHHSPRCTQHYHRTRTLQLQSTLC